MSSFPYLAEEEYLAFPPVEKATEEGIVAVGGNLSPGMLLSAYRQGIFPWFNEGEPILWWSPDPRFVLRPGTLRVSSRTERYIRHSPRRYTFDHAYQTVMEHCRRIPRPGQNGTWITDEMIEGYCRLHELGYAHSLEVWEEGELVGGLYGEALGSVFFGESMFTLKPNASKMAFIALARTLFAEGYQLIDCQVRTGHLAELGAADESRSRFLADLADALRQPGKKSNWRNKAVRLD